WRPVNPPTIASASGTTSSKCCSRVERSNGVNATPLPATCEPTTFPVRQSTRRSAARPIRSDVTRSGYEGSVTAQGGGPSALGLLASCHDRRRPSPALGDAPVDALVELLLQDAIERLLVHGVRTPVRRGRLGSGLRSRRG